MDYGYIRVSTKEQNEDRQRIAMRQWCIPPERIYLDKQSGKDFERPQYRRLLRRLKPNDALVVKSIDRLGGTMRTSSSSGADRAGVHPPASGRWAAELTENG